MNESLRFMMPWLGLSRPNYDSRPDGPILRAAHLHPDEPVFSREEWESVVAYFASQSPENPPAQPPRPVIQVGVPGFQVETFRLTEGPAFVTFLGVDAAQSRLWVGDGQEKTLRLLNPAGRTLWQLPVPSGPVSLARRGESWLVTLIGRVFPSDELAGQVWSLAEPGSGKAGRPERLLFGLRRPVHTSVADLDGDGLEDLVVSAFGNQLGNLSWFRARPEGGFEERVLEEYPGTVKTIPLDWNGDGRTDLLVARAQAREGISVLLNTGHGEFSPQRLLDLPPTFGLVSMELADVDCDGAAELLVVNGDSGDYASKPKSFHGLRIYARSQARDGEWRERFFFPMHGCYGVRAKDFDGDGDLDLALISFFPDFRARPAESFILLRNLGNERFEAFALPDVVAGRGRWLVMDAGDLDGDGDDDLVLGSFFRGPPTIPIPEELVRGWETNGVSILLLRNTRR